MKRASIVFVLLLLPFFIGSEAYSQNLLKKIKSKAEDKVVNKVFGEGDSNSGSSSTNTTTTTSTTEETTSSAKGSKTVQNTTGGGLVTTPPDVKENIASAKTEFSANNYTDARYAVRQAILGVEMEMGQNVLKSLPEKADGMPYLTEEDKVTSSGIGFVGMTIERVYQTEDKELKVTIQNDAAMLTAVNAYLSGGGYAVSSTDQNSKRVKFEGYQALLQYDESTGYTLSVPFGQSSLLVVLGVNYPDEKTMMSAAGLFDIEKIKKELGEK